MEEDLDNQLGSLLDQLKNTNTAAKSIHKEENPLKKEEIETFVVEKAGQLVNEALAIMRDVKDFVMIVPEGENVSALAGLITATATSIETLNKIIVIDKKTKTALKLKDMDIQSKKELIGDITQSRIMCTREELLKQLTLQAAEWKQSSVEVEVLSATSVDLPDCS